MTEITEYDVFSSVIFSFAGALTGQSILIYFGVFCAIVFILLLVLEAIRDKFDSKIRILESNVNKTPNITKGDCFNIVMAAGIELPMAYRNGLPNANCIGCVKATSPTYWNLIRVAYPDVFEERRVQSDRIGAKLVRYKGNRISLTELPVEAKGRQLKNMNFECGIFCEEKL